MLPGVGSWATGAAEPPHAMAVIASTVVSTPRPRRGAHEAALHTEVVGRCGPLVPTNLKAVGGRRSAGRRPTGRGDRGWARSTLERRKQVGAGPGNPRADRPDGAAADPGGLGTARPDDLGQHECGSAVRLERGQQVRHRDMLGVVPWRVVRRDRGRRITHAATTRACSQRVCTDPTGDGQQQRPRRRVTPEHRQRTSGTDERLLRQVIGCARIHEVRAEAPHVGVAASYPRRETDLVAGPGALEQA